MATSTGSTPTQLSTRGRCRSCWAVSIWVAIGGAALLVAVVVVYGSTSSAGSWTAAGATPADGHPASPCETDVWVIRHAERGKMELSYDGLLRSLYLRDLVRNGTWPRFKAIFASSPLRSAASTHADPHEYKTRWAMYQTVLPLASEIGVGVNIEYGQSGYYALARAVLRAARANCGGTVLVAWDHCHVSSVMQAAGCALPLCKMCIPDGWFDKVAKYRVAFPAAGSGVATFIAANLETEGFPGHTDRPSTDTYENYKCSTKNQPWKLPCLLGDMEHLADGIRLVPGSEIPTWRGARNPFLAHDKSVGERWKGR